MLAHQKIPSTHDHADVETAILRAADFMASIQEEDGSWRGDYGGPGFLLPMAVAAYHIAGRPLPPGRRRGVVAYLRSAINADGSVGLHVEAPGCMFTTVLSYVALRLLGVGRDDPDAARMQRWIKENGTALGCASWGKFTLALLNLYPYEGMHPVLPELWLLPRAAPFHPGRLWCHCRQVYLPMAYLYGVKATAPEDELVRQLRMEIYNTPYHQIPFSEHRDTVCEADNVYPASPVLRGVNRAQAVMERRHSARLRRRALASVLDHIRHEDRVTNYIRIGPVNAVLNTVVHVFAGDRQEVERSFESLDRYLFEGHDGVKMQGYNSSALWDTAFALQALLASPAAETHREMIHRAHDYVRDNQVLEDVPRFKKYHRHRSRGGWPFSDRAHGWPITDCTAEGLKCALALQRHVEQPVPEELMVDAVKLILSFQNEDGGWATYERQRGGRWLELLNPSGVFGGIMVDYSYTECTSACVQALARARRHFPDLLPRKIARAMAGGERFIRQRQHQDGGWFGSWGVCFTYGTWFGVEGLLAAGAAPADPAIWRACQFLLDHQNADGGWGEHPDSCQEERYVELGESQAVNTAWALLTLCHAGHGHTDAARRAAEFLVRRQQPDGDWPREALKGVFNRSTLINYEQYRRYFPLWALSAYRAEGL